MTSPMEAIALALEGIPKPAVSDVLEDLAIFATAQLAELKGDEAATAFASKLLMATIERRTKVG